MDDFWGLDLLAAYYQSEAESGNQGMKDERNWITCLKAHGLASGCVAQLEPTERRLRRVYDIENTWYNGNHPLSFSEHRDLITQHRQKVMSYRSNIRQQVDSLDTLQEALSLDDVFSESNIQQAEQLVDLVFDVSVECTEGIIDVFSTIVSSSVEVLSKFGLPPPFSFAVIGLGSVARGEATPYSDMEYAFIVDSTETDYFIGLAMETYFRINNLGETEMKRFDIAELKSKDVNDIDQPKVSGIRIDGITKKAGNIPTGNGYPGSGKLIFTVDEMMESYKSALRSPVDPEMVGDLSDLLSSTVFIFAHGDGGALYNRFLERRRNFEEEQMKSKSVIQKRLRTILEDIKNYPFLPKFRLDEVTSDLKVKSDISRYPTLLASNLKVLLEVKNSFPWEVLKIMTSSLGVISDEHYQMLNIALGLAIFVRIKAYITSGTQCECLSVRPKIAQNSECDRYHIPRNIFIMFGCLLTSLKWLISRSVVRGLSMIEDLHVFDMREFINMCLPDKRSPVCLLQSNFLLQAEVFCFTEDYERALRALTEALTEENVADCNKFMKVIREYICTNNITKPRAYELRALEVCYIILAKSERYNTALDYLETLIQCDRKSNVISWQLRQVKCLEKLQHHKESMIVLDKIEPALMEYFHTESLTLYEFAIKEVQTKHDKTYHDRVSNQAFVISDFYNDRSMTYRGLELYDQALKHRAYSLDILNTLKTNMGVNVDDDLYRALVNRNYVHFVLGEYEKALSDSYNAESLLINLYGRQTAHPDLESIYESLTVIYFAMGDYRRSLQYNNKYLAVGKQLYQDSDTEALSAGRMYHFRNTADILYSMGCYTNGLCLYTLSTVHGPYYQLVRHNLVRVHCELGEYDKASQIINNVLEALDGEGISKGDYTRSATFASLGHLYTKTGHYTEAQESFRQAVISKRFVLSADYVDLLTDSSKCCIALKAYKTACGLSYLALTRPAGKYPPRSGICRYLMGFSLMMLDKLDKAWINLYEALCVLQDFPQYRQTKFHLAQTHTAIGLLLLRLLRLSESREHAVKAADLMYNLSTDNEAFTPDYQRAQREAIMLLDTISLIKEVCIEFEHYTMS